tara:strand:- start:359 stop:700 length:342 start_codon:yes stop_codon:yes gene_type:complete
MICANCNKSFEKKEQEGVIGRLRKYCSIKCRNQNYNRVYRERNKNKSDEPSSRNINKIIQGDFNKAITVDNDWFFSTKVEDWCSSRESKSRAKYKKIKEQRLKEEAENEQNEE